MKESIVLVLLVCVTASAACFGAWLDHEKEMAQIKACKCDCSYTVHNADSIITAKGDTVAYTKNKAWR